MNLEKKRYPCDTTPIKRHIKMRTFSTFIATVLLVSMLFSSCEKEVQITCESMDFSICPADVVTYDTTKAGRWVLIIGIDGLRSDAMQQSISPFLYGLSQSPGVYFTDQNSIEDLTFSGPNWGSLVTGVHWCKHGVEDNDYSDNNLDQTPHFFKLVEEAKAELQTISYVNWTPINEHSAAMHADVAPVSGANDQEIFELASAVVGQNLQTPGVLFLHFDELDGAGHGHGYSPNVPEYAATLSTIDGYIQQIHALVEERRNDGEEWMVFVVTDHGGDGTGHSGGQDNEHISKTIFYADCPEVNFTSRISEQVDLVPTALDYLGVSSTRFECYKDGATLISN